jgi:hypothetical protein
MKAINSKRQESSMIPFRELMFFDEFSVEEQKARSRSFETVSSIQLLKVQQDEIQKLENKIMRLEDEKSALVKWVEYLF